MSPALLCVVAGVAAVLVLASVVGFVLERQARDEPALATIRNLNARTRSWWVMTLVLAGAVALGDAAIVVLFALLSFVALREFWTLTPSRRGDHRALFLSFFVVLPLHYWMVGAQWYGVFAILIPVYGFLILPAVSTLAGDTRDFLGRSARVQWGLMLCVYTISHAPALLMLDTGTDPVLLLLYLVIVAQFSDVLQYVFGKLLGRTRLAPGISPSKTVGGLVGGGLSAIALGTLLAPLTPFEWWQAAGMSTVIVVAGFFGGFVLSAVKRDLGAKDWGYLIHGHGGILDRLDSISFAAPLFFHLTRYWFTG